MTKLKTTSADRVSLRDPTEILGLSRWDPRHPNYQPPPQETTMPIQTRTTYRLRIQDQETGALLDGPTGPHCAEPEIAKSAELITEAGEQLVLTTVLQRLGGDGCWHITDETISEVL
jgi:hypothetical protein